MSSLVQKLSLLTEAGTLTSDDVLQYALYPGRLFTEKEKEELLSIVRDLRTVVPVGRSDAEEYAVNAPGGEEWEAKFAAGLVRTQPLGFARESDMNETREGPYFSLFHPLEENPALRHFAGQLNGSISLLRPTTMRNRSKPMFLTPGIDNDVLGKQTSSYLQSISNQLQVIDAWIGQKQTQLARLKAEKGDDRTMDSLRQEITNLEEQSAKLSLLLRQAYGNVNAYVGARDAPQTGTTEALPGGTDIVIPRPTAPPLEETTLEETTLPALPPGHSRSKTKGRRRIDPIIEKKGEISSSEDVSQSSDFDDDEQFRNDRRNAIANVFFGRDPERNEQLARDREAAWQLLQAENTEMRPHIDAKSQPLARGNKWRLALGTAGALTTAALASNPSLIGQVSTAIGSVYNPTPQNLNLPVNVTSEGAANDHGGSSHYIIDRAFTPGHDLKEYAQTIGKSAWEAIDNAKDASIAAAAPYVPQVDWSRLSAGIAAVPGSLMSVYNDPEALLANAIVRGSEYYAPYLSSSWTQAQRTANLDELAHQTGSFDVTPQQRLGREINPPEGNGPTSNVDTAPLQSLHAQADWSNFLHGGPSATQSMGTEEDELRRMYLERVDAARRQGGKELLAAKREQESKAFEGNDKIDRGAYTAAWGSTSQEVDNMLRTYGQQDDEKKEEAHRLLVNMWVNNGLHVDAYNRLMQVDGFKKAFTAQKKRKRPHGGGGHAPARGRGRTPMRGRGASRVKRQKR